MTIATCPAYAERYAVDGLRILLKHRHHGDRFTLFEVRRLIRWRLQELRTHRARYGRKT